MRIVRHKNKLLCPINNDLQELVKTVEHLEPYIDWHGSCGCQRCNETREKATKLLNKILNDVQPNRRHRRN